MNKKLPSLLFCIAMDIIGAAIVVMPVIGFIWAPVSGIIFYRAFGGWKGAFGGVFSFVEELIPGVDFIPTFTIAWLWRRYGSSNIPSFMQKQNTKTIKAI